jgi:transposase-like protein
VSRITDRVLEGMAEWQNRPLDRVYPVLFIDVIHVKIRDGAVANRPIYTAVGVTTDGERDILGLWAGTGGEGATFWLQVLTRSRTGAWLTSASWSATGSPACPTPSR